MTEYKELNTLSFIKKREYCKCNNIGNITYLQKTYTDNIHIIIIQGISQLYINKKLIFKGISAIRIYENGFYTIQIPNQTTILYNENNTFIGEGDYIAPCEGGFYRVLDSIGGKMYSHYSEYKKIETNIQNKKN